MFLFRHAQGLIKMWLSACFVILLKRKNFQSIVKKTIVDITIRRQLICVFSGMLMGLIKMWFSACFATLLLRKMFQAIVRKTFVFCKFKCQISLRGQFSATITIKNENEI